MTTLIGFLLFVIKSYNPAIVQKGSHHVIPPKKSGIYAMILSPSLELRVASMR